MEIPLKKLIEGGLSSQGCEEHEKHQVPGNNGVQGLAIPCAGVARCENV